MTSCSSWGWPACRRWAISSGTAVGVAESLPKCCQSRPARRRRDHPGGGLRGGHAGGSARKRSGHARVGDPFYIGICAVSAGFGGIRLNLNLSPMRRSPQCVITFGSEDCLNWIGKVGHLFTQLPQALPCFFLIRGVRGALFLLIHKILPIHISHFRRTGQENRRFGAFF